MTIHLAFLQIVCATIILAGSIAHCIRKDPSTKEMNQDKIIQLGYPEQHTSTDPSQVVQLSWQPRVFLYRNLLSDEECDHLISLIHGKKSDALLGDDLPKTADSNISAVVDDEISRRVEERISAWTFLPKENSKTLKVLHFGPEEPKQDYSYFSNKTIEQVDQPLMATVILYLSNVLQGGQILFPQSDNKMWTDCRKSSSILRPTKGNAIVFFNTRLNASPDRRSSHARCPLIQGDLWCAIKLFYLRNISTVKDLPESEDADCTDEDANCPEWAAAGECQRNSVFMIGSPDYYGTCRKSCKACQQQ